MFSFAIWHKWQKFNKWVSRHSVLLPPSQKSFHVEKSNVTDGKFGRERFKRALKGGVTSKTILIIFVNPFIFVGSQWDIPVIFGFLSFGKQVVSFVAPKQS